MKPAAFSHGSPGCAVGGIHGRPTNAARSRAELIGFVCELARRYAPDRSLDRMLEMLRSAHALGQLKVYFNDFGQCVAYLCWAHVTPQVEARLIADPDYLPHLLEWNEGTRLWIVDFTAVKGSLPRVLDHASTVLFPDANRVSYARQRGSQRVVKTLARVRTATAEPVC